MPLCYPHPSPLATDMRAGNGRVCCHPGSSFVWIQKQETRRAVRSSCLLSRAALPKRSPVGHPLNTAHHRMRSTPHAGRNASSLPRPPSSKRPPSQSTAKRSPRAHVMRDNAADVRRPENVPIATVLARNRCRCERAYSWISHLPGDTGHRPRKQTGV